MLTMLYYSFDKCNYFSYKNDEVLKSLINAEHLKRYYCKSGLYPRKLHFKANRTRPSMN